MSSGAGVQIVALEYGNFTKIRKHRPIQRTRNVLNNESRGSTGYKVWGKTLNICLLDGGIGTIGK